MILTIRRTVARLAARPDVVPLLAAALLLLVGAQVALVFKVPSWGNDEPAHMGYVASLAAGDLPDIETDIVDDPARFPSTAEELRDGTRSTATSGRPTTRRSSTSRWCRSGGRSTT